MNQFDNRRVRRVGRPVYGRGNSNRSARPRLNFNINPRKLILPLISTGLAVLIILGFSRLTNIQTIKVEGSSSVNNDQIKKSAEEGLRKQWFGHSLLLVNAGSIEEYIQQAQPAIESVSVKRQFLHTLQLSIKERQSGIRWKTNGVEYFLDSTGAVVGESQPNHNNLPLVLDSKNLPVKSGDRVVPSSFVTFVTQLSNGLSGTGLKAGEASIPETSSELHLKTDKGYIIKFDTTRPAEASLKDLKLILAHLLKQRKTPSEYIDLRIPGKAYYR